MVMVLLAGFLLAVAAPWVSRVLPRHGGWVLAAYPAVVVALLTALLPRVIAGERVVERISWVPGLNVSLSLALDGLSLLFALIIAGIGAVVLIYGGGYLGGHRDLGKFFASILAFMASMVGVVLSDNLLALFVFWELTSLTSYLLIGFDHHREQARKAALQALLVTGGGGLALLAGVVLLAGAGGSWEISALLAGAGAVQAHPAYGAVLVLVLLGAFTKSAQFPFHFWLPNAMEAPTPVSAYLHSATMVKAGVYLLARLAPVLGGTELWTGLVTGFGGLTMVVGALMALSRRDLKQLLAYTTVSSLGLLTLLLGLDTRGAAVAMVAFLLVHALYKGALFLVAGAVDHGTGTRDVTELGGLRGVMPVTFLAAGLAALSMAGVPPLFGFLGKELVYEAGLQAPAAMVVTTAMVVANVCMVAVAALVAWSPFFGARRWPGATPHEAPLSLLLGPVALSLLGLGAGVVSGPLTGVLGAAATAVHGSDVTVTLGLWHGFNPALLLSAATLVLGAVAYRLRDPLRRAGRELRSLATVGPDRWYDVSLRGMVWVAKTQTRILQNGYLRYYLLTVLGVTVGLAGYTLLQTISGPLPLEFTDIRLHEAAVAAVILGGALGAARAATRLAAVAALGVVGFGMALLFVMFGAPDLAMTQFSVETLMVVLFVLVVYRLPQFNRFSGGASRIRDMVVAGAAGALMAALVLVVTSVPLESRLAPYFAEASVPLAKGRNVVNVILVDFRAMDTLGEITVLAVAAMGVVALLRLRPRHVAEGGPEEPGSQEVDQ